MKKLNLFCVLFVLCFDVFAQINLFDRVGDDIVPNPKIEKIGSGLNKESFPVKLCKTYNLSSPSKKHTYKLELYTDNIAPEYQTYVTVKIYYNGKLILKYLPSDLMWNVEYLTKGASREYYLQLPLDDDSFAIFLGGWMYGYDDAPESLIIIVSNGIAKVVFNNYAYAYKYTPGDNFAIEFIDNVDWLTNCTEDSRTPTPPASVLNKLTKYKIWKEGNMLKYKSWK